MKVNVLRKFYFDAAPGVSVRFFPGEQDLSPNIAEFALAHGHAEPVGEAPPISPAVDDTPPESE